MIPLLPDSSLSPALPAATGPASPAPAGEGIGIVFADLLDVALPAAVPAPQEAAAIGLPPRPPQDRREARSAALPELAWDGGANDASLPVGQVAAPPRAAGPLSGKKLPQAGALLPPAALLPDIAAPNPAARAPAPTVPDAMAPVLPQTVGEASLDGSGIAAVPPPAAQEQPAGSPMPEGWADPAPAMDVPVAAALLPDVAGEPEQPSRHPVAAVWRKALDGPSRPLPPVTVTALPVTPSASVPAPARAEAADPGQDGDRAPDELGMLLPAAPGPLAVTPAPVAASDVSGAAPARPAIPPAALPLAEAGTWRDGVRAPGSSPAPSAPEPLRFAAAPAIPSPAAAILAALPETAAGDGATAPASSPATSPPAALAPAAAPAQPAPATLLAAAVPPDTPTPAPSPTPDSAPPPTRQASTIEQVGDLREALRSARPAMVLNHAEFGAVAVRLEAPGGSGDGWRAVLASRDPGFVPAIQAALAERAVAAVSPAATGSDSGLFGGQNSASHGTGGEHRSGSSPSGGQGGSQPYLGHSGSRDGEATPDHRRPSTAAALAARAEAEEGGSGGQAPPSGGLFA